MKTIKYAAVFMLILLFTGCMQESSPLTGGEFLLDTYVTIKLYDKKDDKLLNECFDLIREYENKFSPYIEGSDIYNINKAAGEPVAVSQETLELVQTGIYYGDLSGGLFDITIGGVYSMWDFTGDENGELPDPVLLTEALEHVDYKKIIISSGTVCLTDRYASLELGGIAKGYIADKAAEYLYNNGVRSAIINLGGDIVTIGGKPPVGKTFAIGVQHPFEPDSIATTLEIGDKSIVTSGNYQRYFYNNGVLYFHILNPQTGYPMESGLSSVTIISNAACDGDALSTITFMLGLDAGTTLINSLDDTEAVFITDTGEIITTFSASIK